MDRKYDIFVAYNTNSIVEMVQNRYGKTFKYDETEVELPTYADDLNSLEELKPSEEVERIRKSCFKCIKEYYIKDNQGKYRLYFDILTDEYTKPGLINHVDFNRDQIKNVNAVVFVISSREISFWQLQEAFFASYYNKPIIFLPTKKFLYLIKSKKFDSYISHALKTK